MKKQEDKAEGNVAADGLDFSLQAFLPYLIRVFYTDVTTALSDIYTRDHGLTPSEWRTMAILGLNENIPAAEIVDRSSMDKVSVSRAVKKMYKRGLLVKSENAEDGRSSLLSLSATGRTIYQDLVPKMLGAEQRMIDGMSGADVAAFVATMDRIRKNLRT
jgi:DNA-binding MarR family transcriptional regulator